MTPEFTRLDRTLRTLVAATCAYEVVAITTRRVPTVSRLAKRHPLAKAVVLTALAVHFRPEEMQ